jgi:phosphoribosylformimino-5-aminoimidazole carboxamide ribotide isomerase
MVDAGVADEERALSVLATGAARVVVGLETLPSFEVLDTLVARIGASRVVFSLDLRGGVPLARTPEYGARSPTELALRAADCGVSAVLVLDLGRVGHQSGPDVGLVNRVREVLPDQELLAGGGVRGESDLAMLAGVGCDGVLVATALHRGVRLSVRF